MTDNTQKQDAAAQQQTAAKAPSFEIVRLYCKDMSLETPNSPKMFYEQWKPQLSFEFDAKPAPLADKLGIDTKAENAPKVDNLYEVTLRVTATCKVGKETAFICEVNQAGIFLVNVEAAQARVFLLNGTCPNILFPYAREAISSLTARAGFPPLNMAPINFEALFMNRVRQQQAKAAAAAKQAEEKAADGKKEEPVA